jgi:hypothetical protein
VEIKNRNKCVHEKLQLKSNELLLFVIRKKSIFASQL